MCWSLSKIFPHSSEFEFLDLEPSMNIIYADPLSDIPKNKRISNENKKGEKE